ncbi:MAG: FtsW/RodA/SpoVE family cell cycle protein, partial [Clostridia bacterium]|nr:FtsW/RodA/SpoVE family cell cycle protein [Clostridia bacterium]
MQSFKVLSRQAPTASNRLSTIRKRSDVKGDLSILIVTALLAAFGIVAVYSASHYNAQVQYGDAFYYVKKQLLGFAVGLPVMIFVGRLDCAILRGKRLRWLFLILPIVLLALVFVPGIGRTNYGATRWIGIGPITIQPSELAKYGFVVFASAYMADNMEKVRSLKGALPVLAAGGVICVLILLEPNMSVTMCMGFVMLCMLFAAGLKIKYFLMIFFPLLLAVPVLIIAEPYRLLRLSAFLDPWASSKEEGYQLIQSLYALGNGGWFGTGLFHSRQKYRFL